MSMSVASHQRFTRKNPCPICGGHSQLEHGAGVRCYGFMSEDEEWCHCTREELAPGLAMNFDSRTYAHKMYGKCDCGSEHNPTRPGTQPAPKVTAPTANKYRPPAAEYDYRDEKGTLLFQVLRYTDPKDFRQRIPDGKGGWLYALGETRRVLYRLPELVKADAARLVLIVEGEKDVDNLMKLGFLATCNPMGAGKWQDEYSAMLKGRHVVVIPDNDEVGKEHARQVALSLNGKAASVRVLDLPDVPEKGDVSDWLGNGGTSDGLKFLIKAAKHYRPENSKVSIQKLREIAAKDLPPLKWTVDGILPEGLTAFSGRPKIGKSWLALNIALAVSGGGAALGKIPVIKGDVLYLALEDNERRLKERTLKATSGQPVPEALEVALSWPKLNEGCVLELQIWLENHPNARLVIIDTLAKVRPSRKRNDSIYEDDYNVWQGLKALSDQYRVSFVVITHNRKAESEDPLEEISGSFGLTGGIDNAIILKRGRGTAEGILHLIGRDVEDKQLALSWDAEICCWRVEGTARDYAISKDRKEILDILGQHPEGLAPSELARWLNKKWDNLRQIVIRMRDERYLTYTNGKYYPVYDEEDNAPF